MTAPDTFKILEQRLGHSFQDTELLTRALTHSSASIPDAVRDNERLEFLGDRVLALLAANALMTAYPQTDEGGLAARLNAMVRRETCADVAREIDLGAHLRLAEGEALSGGRQKEAILADACEAVMGALFLDGGLEAVKPFFEANWTARIEALAKIPMDAKTALQEWAQGRGLPTPRYHVIDREGPDHAPEFQVEVAVSGLDATNGRGSSKRVAEQRAARAMLVAQGIWSAADEQPSS